MKEINEITKQYLERDAMDRLLSPTLSELFRGYTPQFIRGKGLLFTKKSAPN